MEMHWSSLQVMSRQVQGIVSPGLTVLISLEEGILFPLFHQVLWDQDNQSLENKGLIGMNGHNHTSFRQMRSTSLGGQPVN